MAYTKKTWVDRVSQYPNRRKLTDTTTSAIQTVTVARDEGTITTTGDIFNAANMNNLENRIESGFNDLNYLSFSGSAHKTNVTVGGRSDGSCSFHRHGPWAVIESHLIASGSKTYTLTNFVPSGFRPAYITRGAVNGIASNAVNTWGHYIIDTDGTITFYISGTGATELQFSATYYTND